jgi:amino acid transporter
VTSWHGFGLAAVLAVYSFLGYEGAVPLGEETSNPRRNVGLAVVIAIVALGVLYVFVTYAAIVGYGTAHLDKLAGDSAAFHTLAHRYLGGSTFLIDIAGLTSTIGSALALLNVQPRIIYNIGRAGLFPGMVSRVHPRWHTPYLAIIVFGALITAIPMIGSIGGLDPLTIFGDFGTFGGLPASIIYMVVSLALIVFWLRHNREGSFWTHLVIPIVGTAVWVWPIYLSIKPAAGLLGKAWLWVVVPVVAGLIFVAWLSTRKDRNPAALAAVLAGEEELPAEESAAQVGPKLVPSK